MGSESDLSIAKYKLFVRRQRYLEVIDKFIIRHINVQHIIGADVRYGGKTRKSFSVCARIKNLSTRKDIRQKIRSYDR